MIVLGAVCGFVLTVVALTFLERGACHRGHLDATMDSLSAISAAFDAGVAAARAADRLAGRSVEHIAAQRRAAREGRQ